MFVKSVNNIVNNESAFTQLVYLYMYRTKRYKQADLRRAITAIGHSYPAASISMWLSGTRPPTIHFIVCVVYALKLAKRQEIALLDAYNMDRLEAFLKEYFEAKARMNRDDHK